MVLDGGDDDKGRLVRHLVAALRKADALAAEAVEGHPEAGAPCAGGEDMAAGAAGERLGVRFTVCADVDFGRPFAFRLAFTGAYTPKSQWV